MVDVETSIDVTGVLNFTQGTGTLWQIPQGSTGDNVSFSFIQEQAPWNNGPPGRNNYVDDVVSLGWNLSAPSVPIDPTKGGICFTMENLFYQSGVFAHEVHLQNVCIDGTTHRPMSFFIPTANASSGVAGLSHQLDYIAWATYAGAQKVTWDIFNNKASLVGGFTLNFLTNNVPVMQQYNAGSTLVPLPYIDNMSRLAITSPAYFTSPITAAAIQSSGPIQISGAAAGQNLLTLQNTNTNGTSGMEFVSPDGTHVSYITMDSGGDLVLTNIACPGAGLYFQLASGGLNISNSSGDATLFMSNAGVLRLNAYGAGTLAADAHGNITAVSDIRVKDIAGTYTRSISDLIKIGHPILYRYKRGNPLGLESNHAYAGFSAQAVERAIPEAVGIDNQGFLTLNDRPILAAAVNALTEHERRLTALEINQSLTATEGTSGSEAITVDGITLTATQLAQFLQAYFDQKATAVPPAPVPLTTSAAAQRAPAVTPSANQEVTT
jgi:hypothetical protein